MNLCVLPAAQYHQCRGVDPLMSGVVWARAENYKSGYVVFRRTLVIIDIFLIGMENTLWSMFSSLLPATADSCMYMLIRVCPYSHEMVNIFYSSCFVNI